jgi:hypothetical protein
LPNRGLVVNNQDARTRCNVVHYFSIIGTRFENVRGWREINFGWRENVRSA